MKRSSFPTSRNLWAGASLLLALATQACTEEKAKPGPVTPPPPVAETNAEARDYAAYTDLIWNDEFDAGTLDESKWVREQGGNGWGNNELQTYTNTNENSYLLDGSLVIEAKKTGSGPRDYTSARLITKGKRDFQFGRIDVRAKLPKGQGIWPAIWMLGSNIDQVQWPTCGEIDIMELRGSQPNQVLSTMHYMNSQGRHEYKSNQWQQLATGTYADDYHVFSVVRSKDQIRTYIDEREVYNFSSGAASPNPFNNPFFLILNVAVGGNFDGDPNSATVFPQKMYVDYVRFYQYKDSK
ncbi:glycoside hydrolase family 16 protein [Hymenobacter sp. BT18]|uniref:glycoside hydrolase family 16 protein n=1 Tax=Hymenobacter sp. BT18 TaxID=2835648 RepID=UPI00143EA535|nr:glycoside hydrolase family 16 protein [Hymenobacter sp. BT18]QIX60573.1 glycoside hydrolase family 16 protein [Hymenobacter sp. BT18]